MNTSKAAICFSVGIFFLVGCTQTYGGQPSASPSASDLGHQPATLPAEATMNAIRASFLTQTAQARSTGGSQTASNTPSFSTVAPTVTGSTIMSTPAGTLGATPAAVTSASPAATSAASTQAATYPVVPTATPGLPATYTIHSGETAFCLARRFNIDPYTLLDFNQLTADYIASPEDVLKIPVTDKKFPGTRALVPHAPNLSYLVKVGDTIYSIGCHFGDVDPNMIALANALTPPDYALTPGKTIRIP
jgi:LysM repeat protein